MISIYKTEKTKANYITTELRGLSSEDKPTSINENIIDNGSTFIEIDTGDKYMYDLENTTWYKIESGNGGGSEPMEKYDYFIDFGDNGLWFASSSGTITDSDIVSQLNAIDNDFMTNKKPLVIYIRYNDGQYTHLSPCTRIETEIDGDNEILSRLVFDVTYEYGDYYLAPYNDNSWVWGRQND